MAVRVCSLIRKVDQVIPSGGYHIVRFPYGDAESYDAHGMHQADPTVSDWDEDDRSGLIWPTVDGWADLTANLHWESGDYSELRDRFVRDPLGAPDSTGTDHRPPSPGMQCFTKRHSIFVHPGTPVSLLVAHNDGRSRRLVHAQFKLAIHPTT